MRRTLAIPAGDIGRRKRLHSFAFAVLIVCASATHSATGQPADHAGGLRTGGQFVVVDYGSELNGRTVPLSGHTSETPALARAMSASLISQTAASPQDQVRQLYLTLLHREPDPQGMAYWTQALLQGAALDDIAAAIRSSDEYVSLHAQSTTSALPKTTYNIYVDAAKGSDGGTGTMASPFRTLARAARAATRPSTTVWVAPGTYEGGIRTSASGTAGARIYWVSTAKWGARIVPPASSTTKVAWDNRGSYVSIVGFDIDGAISRSGTRWTQGIYSGGSFNVIQANRVRRIATNVPCTSAGGSAIGVDSYYKGVKGDVIGNWVHDVGPSGCRYVQGIYISTSGRVINNVVYRIGAAAIHLWHDANDVKIINNTVSTSVFGIVVGGGDFYHRSVGADNVHVHNNIVFDNTYGISEQGRTGATNTYRNNLVYANRTYNWQLKNGLRHQATVTSDPSFIGYSRSAEVPNFRLSAGSPAIGRGLDLFAPPVDIVGRPRNSTTGIDIGAFQH